MTATLIGGTGLTGSSLLRQLLADSAIATLISISRRPVNMASPKLAEVLIADLAQLPSMEAQMRADLYFCCLGTTIKAAGSQQNFEKVDHDAIMDFARIAQTHQAKSFVLVSSMGANANSMFFYNRVKGRTEDDVTALGLRSLTIFRPALLVGPRPENRLTERFAMKTVVPLAQLLPASARKLFLTDADTLASRMLAEGRAAATGVHVISAKAI